MTNETVRHEPWSSNPSFLRAAAWVPDDPEQSWDEAADLAVDWIRERSRIEGVAPMVVTNTLDSGLPEVLEGIARNGGRTSPQAKGRYNRGPVLAYVPDERSLGVAVDLARGHSLAVVEGFGFALAAWAAGVGAINLLSGTTTTGELSEEVRRDLGSVVFFGGNNGWTGSHEKDHARRKLAGHVRTGALSPEAAAAYVMSQGVSDRDAKRLRELLGRS